MIRLTAKEKRFIRSKYGAVKTTVDGITFASKAESKRYGELKMLEKAGKISMLSLQPKYEIRIGKTKIATYVGDFVYLDDKGASIVEDVKGVKTPVYRLKKKIVEAIYGIQIMEIGKPSVTRGRP